NGSKREAKKAPVDSTANVTDTFEALMAPKKVSQCKAIIIPARAYPDKVFSENLSFSRFNFRKAKIIAVASNIRYQTSGMASKVINLPKMAVKPHIKTMRWRWR